MICIICGLEIENPVNAQQAMHSGDCKKKYRSAKQREYYQRNQQHYIEFARQYRKTHNTSRDDEYTRARSNGHRRRNKMLKYYPPTCHLCNQHKKLALHHINHIPDDDRFENLVQLCYSCHKRVHSGVETIVNIRG